MNKLSDPKPCEPSYGHCIVLSQYLVASKYTYVENTCQECVCCQRRDVNGTPE